jgi:hypothetical protein
MLESILLIVFAVLITALIGMLPCWLLMVIKHALRLVAHSDYQYGRKAYVFSADRQLKAH